MVLRPLDRFHHIVAQVAFAFARDFRHGLGGRESLLKARRKHVKMQMHIDGVRACCRRDGPTAIAWYSRRS